MGTRPDPRGPGPADHGHRGPAASQPAVDEDTWPHPRQTSAADWLLLRPWRKGKWVQLLWKTVGNFLLK